MPRSIVAAALLLSLACTRAEGNTSSAFDRAADAVGRAKFKQAAELFADAAKTDDDPVRRAKAEIRLANIEWRIFETHDAARVRKRGRR